MSNYSDNTSYIGGWRSGNTPGDTKVMEISNRPWAMESLAIIVDAIVTVGAAGPCTLKARAAEALLQSIEVSGAWPGGNMTFKKLKGLDSARLQCYDFLKDAPTRVGFGTGGTPYGLGPGIYGLRCHYIVKFPPSNMAANVVDQTLLPAGALSNMQLKVVLGNKTGNGGIFVPSGAAGGPYASTNDPNSNVTIDYRVDVYQRDIPSAQQRGNVFGVYVEAFSETTIPASTTNANLEIIPMLGNLHHELWVDSSVTVDDRPDDFLIDTMRLRINSTDKHFSHWNQIREDTCRERGFNIFQPTWGFAGWNFARHGTAGELYDTRDYKNNNKETKIQLSVANADTIQRSLRLINRHIIPNQIAVP